MMCYLTLLVYDTFVKGSQLKMGMQEKQGEGIIFRRLLVSVQGMNFIAGCLLLFMEEEDAFWCLTTIVEQLLSGYFSTTMAASQV